MKKYPTYKPSNIDWIGDIPEHWEAIKLKYLGKALIGITYSPDNVVNQENGVLVLRSSNVQDGYLAFEDCIYVDKSFDEKYYVREGDILLCARNGSAHLVGKSAYINKVDENMTFGAFMSIVRSDLKRYLFYFFNSQIFKAQTGLFSTSTINQLTSDTLNNMVISFPNDFEEQTAIANYLDKKTKEIDQLIEDKKRLLQLFEEEKTAIISQAITKGLNPNQEFKNSDIEWIGDIPIHWKIKKIKYVATINDETLPETTDENYEIEYIEISNVKSGIGIIETNSYIFKNAPSRARRIVRDGDIIVSTVRTYLKSIAKVDEPKDNWIASTGFAVVRPRELNNDFMGYLFYSEGLIGEIISKSTGVSYPAINASQIGEIYIPIPSVEEQIEIVQQIETQLRNIKLKIKKNNNLIDLLTEYRSALISEVVTGKVNVIE